MKNIIVILFTLLSVNSFSQTREGLIAVSNRNVTKYVEPKHAIIDFNNLDTTLLIECFVDLCNRERFKHSLEPVHILKNIANKAAQFHANYLYNNGTFSHWQIENLEYMRPSERFDSFSRNRFVQYDDEILDRTWIPNSDVTYNNDKTYYELAKIILEGFLTSDVGHRECVLKFTKEKRFISFGFSFGLKKCRIDGFEDRYNKIGTEFNTCIIFTTKKSGN
jgi:hypothetical protein